MLCFKLLCEFIYIYSYTGGIIDNLNPWNMVGGGKAFVEGCMNMASVKFNGNTRNDEFIVAVGRVIAFSSLMLVTQE